MVPVSSLISKIRKYFFSQKKRRVVQYPSVNAVLVLRFCQHPPRADPGGDVSWEDQPGQVARGCNRESVCEDQQPRTHRHPGVHRLLLL